MNKLEEIEGFLEVLRLGRVEVAVIELESLLDGLECLHSVTEVRTKSLDDAELCCLPERPRPRPATHRPVCSGIATARIVDGVKELPRRQGGQSNVVVHNGG